MSPSFRSSGTTVSMLTQKDGRVGLVVAQVNIVPVTAGNEGMDLDPFVRAAISTVNDQNDRTMDAAEIIEALRYVADKLEAQQR
jgi:hypothetical protein